MSVRKIFVLPLLLLLSLLISFCSNKEKQNESKNQRNLLIKKKGIFKSNIHEVKIRSTKIYKGFLIPSSQEEERFYVEENTGDENNNFFIKIIDKANGKVTNKVSLNKVDFKVETKKNVKVDFKFISSVKFNQGINFQSPSYICFLDNNYYIICGFSKIITFDRDFNPLYSSKFQNSRYFVGFFKKNKKIQFIMGIKKDFITENNVSRATIRKTVISQYHLFKYREISRIKTIYKENIDQPLPSFYEEGQLEKVLPCFNVLPALFGFLKDSKLYYSIGTSNKYYIYAIDNPITTIIELAHLKAKKYTQDEIDRIKRFKLNPKYKQIMVVHLAPFTGNIFHLGLIDAGKNKIAFVNDIDIKRMVFKLDILEAETGDYIKSIILPCSISFMQSLERGPALFPIIIDCDLGIYIRSDWQDKDPGFVVKYSRFEEI